MISKDQIAMLRRHATDPDYHTAIDCCIGEPENGIIDLLDTLEALWKVAEAAKSMTRESSLWPICDEEIALREALAALDGKDQAKGLSAQARLDIEKFHKGDRA